MTNSKALFLDLVDQVKTGESGDEIQAIIYMVLEKLFSLSRAEILSERSIFIGNLKEKKITEIVSRINNHEPIQYILGYADFFGRRFEVTPDVLIPRPETEELVKSVIPAVTSKKPLRIVDIGTGSGCIAITLALEIRRAAVFATDISQPALAIAKRNARSLLTDVRFFHSDILTEAIPCILPDVVISNPPYVTQSDQAGMTQNVAAFEPHLALFVADNDPLIFYRALVERAFIAMRPQGILAVEINERFGGDVASLFEDRGYADVRILRDIFGKERIVKGIIP